MTRTIERKALLESALIDDSINTLSLLKKFHEPPLFNTQFAKAFGTLYTAIYSPITKGVTLSWPKSKELHQTIEKFEEGKIKISLKTDVSRYLTV